MLEILKLIEINSRYSFVNLSVIFRLIIAILSNKPVKRFPAGNELIYYELILFESIFSRAPPPIKYSPFSERFCPEIYSGEEHKRG